MINHALDSDWWTATDWSSEEVANFTLTGAGSVEFGWFTAEPAAAAAGAPIEAGQYSLARPLAGQKLYLRVTSGSADIDYSSKDGPSFSSTLSGHAFSGDAGADEDFTQTALPSVGFDDLTTRTGANPYEFQAYLTTIGAGVLSTDSLTIGTLVVRFIQWIPGRTFRVYGIKYATDQSANITDWDTLGNRTKTTAYADATTVTGPFLSWDVLAILEELQAVSGWDGDSPIQFFIEDTGAALTDADARAIIDVGSADTRVAIMLSGGEPVPDPGTGGP